MSDGIKGAKAVRGEAERQRKLGEMLDSGLLKALEEDPAFVSELPSGLKAELLGKRAPKVKDLDGEVEAGLMSLAGLLERAGGGEMDDGEKDKAIALLRERVRRLEQKLRFYMKMHAAMVRGQVGEVKAAIDEGAKAELEGIVRMTELKRGWLLDDREMEALVEKVYGSGG